jgi:hypothetical protein
MPTRLLMFTGADQDQTYMHFCPFPIPFPIPRPALGAIHPSPRLEVPPPDRGIKPPDRNPGHRRRHRCMSDSSGSLEAGCEGATTAIGCIDAIAVQRPDVFLGENVVGFAQSKGTNPSDLEVMVSRLAAIDFQLVDYRVSASDYGSPTPRDRPSRKSSVWPLMQPQLTQCIQWGSTLTFHEIWNYPSGRKSIRPAS